MSTKVAGVMVLWDKYERARAINTNFIQMFIDLAADELQKGLHSTRCHIKTIETQCQFGFCPSSIYA